MCLVEIKKAKCHMCAQYLTWHKHLTLTLKIESMPFPWLKTAKKMSIFLTVLNNRQENANFRFGK